MILKVPEIEHIIYVLIHPYQWIFVGMCWFENVQNH